MLNETNTPSQLNRQSHFISIFAIISDIKQKKMYKNFLICQKKLYCVSLQAKRNINEKYLLIFLFQWNDSWKSCSCFNWEIKWLSHKWRQFFCVFFLACWSCNYDSTFWFFGVNITFFTCSDLIYMVVFGNFVGPSLLSVFIDCWNGRPVWG